MKTSLVTSLLGFSLLVLCSCATDQRLPTMRQYSIHSASYALGHWPLTWWDHPFNEGHDPDNYQRCLRMTYTPAFDPEFTVTFAGNNDDCTVEVRKFSHRLWPYVQYHDKVRGGEGPKPERPTVQIYRGKLTLQAARRLAKTESEITLWKMTRKPHLAEDGIGLKCEYSTHGSVFTFVFHTPHYYDDKRYDRLAGETLRACYGSDLPHQVVAYLEKIEGMYLVRPLFFRKVSTNTVRLYGHVYNDVDGPTAMTGRLKKKREQERKLLEAEWQRFIAAITSDSPVLVDLTGLVSVDTFDDPNFKKHPAPENTYWVLPQWKHRSPEEFLKRIGVPRSRTFSTVRSARAAIRDQ